MKLNLRFNRMSETEKDRQLVNQELATLAKELPIRGAEAVVEHPEQDVSIRMRVKLDLPGSPVVAEAKDALKRKLSRRNQGRGATPYDRRRHSMPTAARA
jgi:hypothetical protein